MATLSMVVLLVILGFGFTSSTPGPTILLPTDAPRSFDLTLIKMINAGACSYLVNITTSCLSSTFTRDHISITFGDASGSQVYSPLVVNPLTKAFSRCSTDAFQITGPCANRICYLYVQRTGEDGWKPETVKVYTLNSSGPPAVFSFNSTSIPADAWYGFNVCSHPSPPHLPPSPPDLPPSPPYHPPSPPDLPPSPPYHPPSPPYYPPSNPPPPRPSSSPKLFSRHSFAFVFLGLVLNLLS